jgi:hypothetical protein
MFWLWLKMVFLFFLKVDTPFDKSNLENSIDDDSFENISFINEDLIKSPSNRTFLIKNDHLNSSNDDLIILDGFFFFF